MSGQIGVSRTERQGFAVVARILSDLCFDHGLILTVGTDRNGASAQDGWSDNWNAGVAQG